MAKKVSNKDLIVGDPLAEFRKSAKLTIEEFKKLELGLKGFAKAAKSDLKGIKLDSFTNISKATQSIQTIDKSFKGLNQTTKERIKLQDKLKRANSDSIQKNAELQVQLQAQTKTNKQLAREALGLVGAYEKQAKKLISLRKRFKDIVLVEGESSKAAIKLQREITKLNDKLVRVDKSAGQFSRVIGKYPSQMGKATAASLSFGKSLIGAFGVVGGVQLFASAMRDAFQRIRDFDKEIVGLGAILGKSRGEIQGLEKAIIDVAGASIKTSNEVAKLATTLITLGKSEKEVVQLLKPVNDLSIALGATSDEAGELLVQTLNAFGKGSDSAENFADIISKMRTSTALDFQRIKDALGFLAPTARAAGISFEETGGLLGVLVDNGIKASRAGRLLSSTFLKLADEGKTLEDALDIVNNAQARGVKETGLLSIASKLFGKESAALGLILADNRDRTAELTKEFENAGGTLEKLTNKQLQSTDARLKILDSTYEKLILTLSSSDGVLDNLFKGFINGLIFALGFVEDFIFQMGRFTDVVVKELTPAFNVFSKVFDSIVGLFGDFTGEIDKSDIVLRAITTSFKFLILPIRLAINSIKTIIDTWKVLINEGKKLANFFGTDFDINDQLSFKTIADDLKKHVEIIKSTFTLFDELKDKEKDLREETEKGSDARKEITATIEGEGKALNDLIETQRTLLKLAQGFAGTTEPEIASRNQKIAVINEEIKRLQALGRLRTDSEILEAQKQSAKEAKALRDAEAEDQKRIDKENQDRLDRATQRREDADKQRLAQLRGAAAEEQRIHEQRVEAAIRASNIISEAFGNALNDVFDEQEKALNASIKRREEGVERQQRRAENGLDNQLAFEKKKLAEAEVERQALAEKRARQEEALALAQTYLNFVQARAATDPDTANIKALQDTLAAKAIKDGIVALAGSAYDGEEDTGKVYGGGLDGKGGRLWMLHDNEGVVTKKGNQDNAGLVGAMNSGDVTGWFANNMVAPELKTNNYDTFALLAQKMDSLEETIKKRPIPSFAFDKYGNIIQSVYRNGVKDTTTHVNKESII